MPVVQISTAQTAIKFIAKGSGASTELRTSNTRTDAVGSSLEGKQVLL